MLIPRKLNSLVMVVSNSVPSSNTLKFDDVVGVILSEEMRRKSTGETSGNALTMESRGRQNERGRSLVNHDKSKKGRSKSRFGKIECWKCGNKGHLKKDCRAPKKKGERQQETTQEANGVGDVLKDALIPGLDNTSDYWVVDSGALKMLHPIVNSFMILFKVILGMCYWGMMNHVKLLERLRYRLS